MKRIGKIFGGLKTLSGPFPPFHTEHLPQAPHILFGDWFQTALDQGEIEPHAMTLSTIDPNGFPDARVLILKDFDTYGWYFASSSKSKKGLQILQNPKVSLTFYWPVIGRQVRVRGMAVNMGNELSARDFLQRGKVARAIALIGKQSSILDEQDDLEEAVTKQLDQLERNPHQIDPYWTLYRVEAEEVEFWQGDENRKHTRVIYQLTENEWVKKQLWP
ncbi:pyridoxine/pyridoxamine 5'-phosphate oxidase [Hazenella coriacea]|uniref:Pyridoxamine 5'-phosphate oxidase n=1 Tax=Hazenella coriacea TaxID=1179467 RepID=A0A4R3L224_9BACL|nr:pyridoxal 5'-phosphate synthase [Hazenella coriacea]TCS93222.1 pyridoxamine 5'-phosphate oxidase [Hazenella coriacea]